MIEFSDRVAHAVQAATTSILPILFAITLHEAAHAFAAARLGDDTALRQGRVSLNPVRHIDIFRHRDFARAIVALFFAHDIWLGKASTGGFPTFAQSALWHGFGGGGWACHKYYFGDHLGLCALFNGIYAEFYFCLAPR